MGNTISRIMDYMGKKFTDTRKGSPRYRNKKKRWKNKRDLKYYKMIRGEDFYEDELYEMDSDGIQVVQL
jgi:hypothetical protein